MKVSIVIPVYNERELFPLLLKKIGGVPLSIEREIIAVDDASTDGSREMLKTMPGIKALFHEKNKGKGAALRTGFAAATGDIILVQDADLEYNPNDYPALLEPIIRGDVDVVYGSRFLNSQNRYLTLSYYANKFLTFLTQCLTSLPVTDM